MAVTAYPHCLTPLTLAGCTVKNRIVFGAHTANMSEGGLPGEQHLHYYLARARGGCGMIVVEPVPAHRTAVLTRGNFLAEDDAVIPGFRRITEACKAHGTVMVQQIYHVGAHGDYDNSLAPNWSPSGRPSFHDAAGSHAMTAAEVEEVIAAHVAAALRAQRCGFDGVEMMAAYNALLEQFWLPLSNRRGDRFGGGFDNRMRFSREIFSRIRERAGRNFILGLAVSEDLRTPGAITADQLLAVAGHHDEKKLIDYITVGTGSYFDFSRIIPHCLDNGISGAALAARMRKKLKFAKVQAEAHITHPGRAEKLLAAGEADLVSIVRGQIADPDLAAKAMRGEGEDIRPCIACNQGCWGRRSRDYHISCLVNPSAGREKLLGGDAGAGSGPARKQRSITVIGGGPAGMEFSRVAAMRGHRVRLLEKEKVLGGAFRLAAAQPGRAAIGDFLDWCGRQLHRHGVRLATGVTADESAVDDSECDAAIVATGASPNADGYQRALPDCDRLPGADEKNVCTVTQALRNPGQVGGRVIILDDTNGWPAAGTALLLAAAGRKATILTSAPAVAEALAASAVAADLRARLARAGVAFRTDSVLLRWHKNTAEIRNTLTQAAATLAADTLILATTPAPDPALADALRAACPGLPVHSLGDCHAPRHALAAILDARRLAVRL
ncbi:MAG: FAD-dependent oxidoreductase [Gammaproteobacteria bacterium]|nr:FAD-dependent oxidoreductase [Gammaproteobacteria bacterium]